MRRFEVNMEKDKQSEQARADALDAARYRWLREQPNDFTAPRIDICYWTCENGDSVNNGEGLRGAAADEAIDAAMKSQRGAAQ
jgi:hypothetical protein